MNEQAFDLLLFELRGLKKGQERLEALLEDHNKVDTAVHQQVNRHVTYFQLIAPVLLAVLAVAVAYVKEKLRLWL